MYHMNNSFWRNVSPSSYRRNGPSSNNRPTDPVFIWNATSHDIVDNSPTSLMKLVIYPVIDGFQQGLTISHGTLAIYPFDQYNTLLVALLIWPYPPVFQLRLRDDHFCSRAINKQLSLLNPLYSITTRCVSFLLPFSKFYHLIGLLSAVSKLTF